ncbi:MAG TPA: 4-amino-4-deoxy-L-arabinose transferase, partial [Halanaerobiales bacterium]|nr:4-amino-4-deoxy-L-arabinose transferase [Halanaerobiales bacterium]
LGNLEYFYKKLFYGISGTYYTPAVKFQFIIFFLGFVWSLLRLIFKKDKKNTPLLLLLVGINLAYIIIGRYNQTSIIFIFPVAYLLISSMISSFRGRQSHIIALLLIMFLAFNTGTALLRDINPGYEDYLQEIGSVINKDERVLANLNADYYFQNGKLFDYRNLAYLEENNLSFEEYIRLNQIEYIIYPEEMDFIYNSRPVWNILYGNLFPYYQDMKEFLSKNCQLVHEFTDRNYGMRISRYIGQKEWKVKIYRVKAG